MRVGAAQEGRVQQAWQLHVVNEQRLAAQQPRVFVAGDARADIRLGHQSAQATARQNAASPPLNFQGNTPSVMRLLWSAGRPMSPPRFSTWMQSWGNRALCVSW